MKRGVYAVLGVLAVAGTIAIAPAASAAQGTLVVNNTVYRGPSGCMQIGGGAVTLAIENHTDRTVSIFTGSGCRGDVTATIVPGETRTSSGSSIQIG
ncbi:hypothetical protein ACFQZZ_13915 [Nocardia sp. GCM10030253]|uniref:hypothetical protein n=1 Tax=Nocardia sp. GCM10030253 TaxID=3273404 RepID=UPI003637FF85